MASLCAASLFKRGLVIESALDVSSASLFFAVSSEDHVRYWEGEN
jgi:hypothetical protein